MNFRGWIQVTFAAALAVSTYGHAVVQPPQSTASATQQYTLRVPNEKQIVTTSIELTVPADLLVTAANDVAGWKLSVVRDAAGRITRATWTGSLAPGASVLLPFTARNPATPTTLEWRVIQTFQDGSKAEWIGPQGSKTPASRTEIVAGATAK